MTPVDEPDSDTRWKGNSGRPGSPPLPPASRPAGPARAEGLAQSRFLATMSHELRTPLNVVIGFSDAIMRDTAGALTREQVIDYSGSINEAGRQLLTLVDVILDVARVEGGQSDMPSDLMDVEHLVATAVAQIAAVAATGSLTLQSYVPPGLPLLRGDERRLRQSLGHMLANAVKFTPAGGAVRVSARQEPASGDLLLLVSDTGIGIAEADLERVFEPFVQLDASFARRFSGSGLGLYVSRVTARAHGGELLLQSKLRTGTTAVLQLPAFRLVNARDPLPPSQDPP